MTLNGAPVTAAWDDATGLVSYTPPAPLKPGVYQVSLTVHVQPARSGWTYEPLRSTFSFTVADSALAVLPEADAEQRQAVAYLNQHRQAAGLPLLEPHPSLMAAAQAHARYLVANYALDPGHRQIPGTPLYFGTTVGDRARFYGYSDSGTSEVLSFVTLAEEAIDGWLATPYHRISLIHPGNRFMGYGQAGTEERANVIKTGTGQPGDQVVLWPYPGMKAVATGWNGLETPDPLRLYPGTEGPVGYTITATWGNRPARLTLSSASLTDAAGRSVPVMQFSPERDEHLTETVALIPYKPLAPGTTYTARLAGTVDHGKGPVPYSHTWSFTTSGDPYLAISWSQGSSLSRTLEGHGFRQGMQVFFGELPVQNLKIESETRLSFSRPAGYQDRSANLLLVHPGGLEEFWGGNRRAMTNDPAGSPFSRAVVSLSVGGRRTLLDGLRHPNGTVMIAAADLERLGATAPEQIAEIRRTYWRFGTRQGSVVEHRAVAYMDGRRLVMPLPAQTVEGKLYVPALFAEALLGASGRAAVVPPPMRDVAGHWAAPEITQLVELGVIAGYPDGTFRPGDPLTRAAFVKLLVAARELPLEPGASGGFTDTQTHWAAAQGYLAAAVRAGILLPDEFPGLRLNPDGNITRGEIAVMLVRALGLEAQALQNRLAVEQGRTVIAGRTFTDVALWPRPGHVGLAAEKGIISGYREADSTFTFRPASQATRAEAAVMVVRMLNQR